MRTQGEGDMVNEKLACDDRVLEPQGQRLIEMADHFVDRPLHLLQASK
jgi:hypothetical protein